MVSGGSRQEAGRKPGRKNFKKSSTVQKNILVFTPVARKPKETNHNSTPKGRAQEKITVRQEDLTSADSMAKEKNFERIGNGKPQGHLTAASDGHFTSSDHSFTAYV